MTALALIGFAGAVALGAHRLIERGDWVSRSPRLGLLAWLASAAGVITAAAAAGMAAFAHEWSSPRSWVDAVWRLCWDALAGGHGRPAQAVAVSSSVLLAAGVVRIAIAWRHVVAGAARQRRAHRAMLRLADPAAGGRDLAVLAHPEPVAYVVAGRPAQVVVSTSALTALSSAELAAVLAHEHAHAAGRHHWLLGASALARRAFPGVPLFRRAARQTARLVEMCADDVAVRSHARLSLARALVAMAVPATPGVIPAAGGDATERLRRLLEPPDPLPAATRLLIALGFPLLPLLPVLILVVGPPGPPFA